MIHTGDITHLSKSEEFDNADQVIGKAKLDTFCVPGEHDLRGGSTISVGAMSGISA
jgi:3',5'-cyclic-AMP phosphodiesterase